MRHPTLSLLALLTACTAAAPGAPGELVASTLSRNTSPDVTETQVRERASGNRAFAFDLYGELRQAEGNLFLSPHSISSALAMTWAGAATTTATQMSEVLRFDAGAEVVHPTFNQLDLDLASRETLPPNTSGDAPKLRIVNQTFGQAGYAFEDPFLDTLAVDYGAGMRLMAFGADPDGSRTEINDWVLSVTNDRIVDLLPPGSITSDTKLVLANAIWFKAPWATPFETSATTSDAFTTPTGSVNVDTMHGLVEGSFGQGTDYVVADIPYLGNQLSMTILLPDAGTFDAFEAGLTGASFDAAIATLQGAELDLSLPKFGFSSDFDLVPALSELGMPDLFNPNVCDLSAMSTTSALTVSGVFHQGFVAVDEEGTEAAAATAVVTTDTSAPERFTVTIDRPFLLAIRDRPTGALLFLGRVLDPTK